MGIKRFKITENCMIGNINVKSGSIITLYEEEEVDNKIWVNDISCELIGKKNASDFTEGIAINLIGLYSQPSKSVQQQMIEIFNKEIGTSFESINKKVSFYNWCEKNNLLNDAFKQSIIDSPVSFKLSNIKIINKGKTDNLQFVFMPYFGDLSTIDSEYKPELITKIDNIMLSYLVSTFTNIISKKFQNIKEQLNKLNITVASQKEKTSQGAYPELTVDSINKYIVKSPTNIELYKKAKKTAAIKW